MLHGRSRCGRRLRTTDPDRRCGIGVTLETQPPTATCTLDAAASGTVSTENITVLATCTIGTPLPNTVQPTCDAVTRLSCPNYTLTACVDAFVGERATKNGACTTTFDALLNCFVANVNHSTTRASDATRTPPVALSRISQARAALSLMLKRPAFCPSPATDMTAPGSSGRTQQKKPHAPRTPR
ncbi:MAG: hypothetical protein ACI9MR_000233 [Myxococcota bacterium]|jgi:hypothetical protein